MNGNIEYNIMENIGKSRYVLSYYKGKKHKDGSKFFDIKIFKNKKKLNNFIKKMGELQEIDTRIKNTYNKAEVNALNIEREQLMELLGD